MTNGNGVKVSWGVVQTIAAWVVSALVAWGVVQARIAVLEDRYDRMSEDVREIKQDVKILLKGR
ncbi:MAG: hypothetical protein ACREUC_12600 [Steroidobacteraceae bacterium]